MIRFLLPFIVLLSFSNITNAQEIKPIIENKSGVVDEISKQQRLLINQRIQQNIDSLKEVGLLTKTKDIDIKFSFPLLPADNVFDMRYYGITNFVDHNSDFPNQLTDYTCGTRTFDRENGYNHSGTDFSLYPFPWRKMDEDKVAVVAAAPGTIIEKMDGNPDKSCTLNDKEWNAVYVRHDDGSVAWYGSLKANSLTEKSIGERVEVGEKLGIVGSSGSSTAPHLHFEVRHENGEIVDPFSGECNPSESLWKDQPEYIDTEFSLIQVSREYFGEELDLECGEAVDQENIDATLEDSIVRVYFFLHDLVKNKPAYVKVRDPSGKLAESFTFVRTDDQEWAEDFYKFSSWEFFLEIPNGAQTGIWNITLTMDDGLFNQDDGELTHKFSVSSVFTKPNQTENLNPENGTMIDDSDTYLRWVPMADADFYTVQIAEDEGFSQGLEELTSTNRSVEVSGLSTNKKLYWRVKSQNQYGESEWSEISNFSTGTPTNIDKDESQRPKSFELSQNYPNPFNPTTQIKYTLENVSPVKLSVFNALGRQVEVLIESVKSPGAHSITFDASELPSGIYYYELQTPNFTEVKPMTLIK